MADTPKLKFPEIGVSQSSKETTHNESLWILDALVQSTVKDKDLATPPGSPVSGDCYIVGASATDAWAGMENYIAQYKVDTWVFYAPNVNTTTWVADEAKFYRYNGSAWEIALNGADLSVANEWTKTQNFNATTLTDAANIAWDLESNQVCSVTLADNRTLDNPTNMKDGATYILIVKQDGTGNRTLAYGAAYKWAGGASPTLSTDANAVDIITFVSDGTSMYGVFNGDFS